MGEDWTQAEVEAIVADYREMLSLELQGESYNKSERNKLLRAVLNDRSKGSVEFKHANISAVLTELDFPAIRGYKKRVNVQELLRQEVARQVGTDFSLQLLAQKFVDAPAIAPRLVRPLSEILIPAPVRDLPTTRIFSPLSLPILPRLGVDYHGREARNLSLGLAGEKFVLDFEHRSLWESGAKRLAEKVEHVSQTRGDGLGYDILSFAPNGRERLIEVKTTGLGVLTPFFASKREVTASEEQSDNFSLYRVFAFRDTPKLFVLEGSLRQSVILDPVQYRASIQFRDGG